MEKWDQNQSQISTIIGKILLSEVFNTALVSEKFLSKRRKQRAVERFTALFYTGDRS